MKYTGVKRFGHPAREVAEVGNRTGISFYYITWEVDKKNDITSKFTICGLFNVPRESCWVANVSKTESTSFP